MAGVFWRLKAYGARLRRPERPLSPAVVPGGAFPGQARCKSRHVSAAVHGFFYYAI